MKMKKWTTFALVGVMTVINVMNVFAESSYVNGGNWTDKENLIWTYNSGEKLEVGKGPVYSDVYPDITDPEYLLKEYYAYPEEADIVANYNSWGQLKVPFNNHMDEALPLLQEFVHSFDWLHSDEKTRYEKVYERIALGCSGNSYGGAHNNERFQILRTGLGLCAEFSNDFAALCKIVGLECVTYIPSVNHQACLIKINGQWLAIDPTDGTANPYSNSHFYPVDYETEYNRYNNEYKNSETYKQVMDGAELQRKAETGEITWTEYFQTIYPEKSITEIEEMLGMDLDSYAKLWQE